MRKVFFFAAIVTMLSLLVLPQTAQAQSETPKLEVGLQYTLLRLRAIQALNDPILDITDPDFVVTDSGVGG